MIKAARTPGTQPKAVSIKTISTDPQPLSITASGGSTIASNTRQKLIFLTFYFFLFPFTFLLVLYPLSFVLCPCLPGSFSVLLSLDFDLSTFLFEAGFLNPYYVLYF
jgi:hypothetical protein